jgi:hypothetical protein
VLVSTQNLSLKRVAQETPSSIYGAFRDHRDQSCHYEIDLPNKLRMHNVFHVSLLRPYIEEVPRSLNSSSTEGEHEFVVHKILKHDMIKVSLKKTQLECLIVERARMSITLGKLWIAHCPEIVAEVQRHTNYDYSNN